MKNKLIIYSIVFINIFVISIFNSSSQELTKKDIDLKIISRKEWGAKLPIKKMNPQNLDKITIHHSGVITPVKVNLIEKMQKLQNYSQSSEKMANGKIKEIWADIPYHFVISGTGEIAEGREINYSGDTNTEYDPKNHILIDVLGNFDEQIPTNEQLKSLVKLCTYLSKKYHIPIEKIEGHNHYAVTNCPGKNLSKLIPDIKQNLVEAE